jgi:DNA repair photolyase
MGFWSINPYIGCEFGCTYCYARVTHRYAVERAHYAGKASTEAVAQFRASGNWEMFERHIFVKRRQAVLTALERDLVRIHLKNTLDDPHPIIIGTATDPYQPAERRFQITRAIVERFLDARGLAIGIITKSPLICRDTDLLGELGRRHRVTVYISLISTDIRTIKLFEPRASMPHARLRTLQKLNKAGIRAGINAAPILPGVTDSVFQIDALMLAARAADTAFVHPSVLRFYPAARDHFLSIIAQHFPNLIPRYRVAYRGNWDAPSSYVTAVQRRFQRIARKHGIDPDDPLQVREHRVVKQKMQLSLL